MNFKEYFLKEDLGDFFKRDAGNETKRFLQKLVPIGKGSYVGQAAKYLKDKESILKGGGTDDKVQRDAKQAGHAGGGALQKFFEKQREKFKDVNLIRKAEVEIKNNPNIPFSTRNFKLESPNDRGEIKDKTFTGLDHYGNVVLDVFKRYMVDKNYSPEDAGNYTINAFYTRTKDSQYHRELLKSLKNNGLLYKDIANNV